MSLLERESELEAIESQIDALAQNASGGGLCVVAGPPGVGKTALLDAARERASDEGLLVLSATGSELEREYAWSGAMRMFAPLLERAEPAERDRWLDGAAGISRSLIEGSRAAAGPAAELFPFLHGLQWLAANVAVERPLVIAVDDAQWLDGPSLRFLVHLVSQADDVPIAVFATVRTGEPDAPHELLEQLDERAAVRLEPALLSRAASARVARAELRRPPTALVDECFEASGGNPFLLRQLIAELAEAQREGRPVERGRLASLTPRSVARTIMRRLRKLPPEAIALAQAAAVFGSAALGDAAGLAEIDIGDAASAADALSAALILATVQPLRFVHPLVRSSVYESLPPAQRLLEHLAAARILHARGERPERVAAHLLEAHRAGDPWVVDQLRVAAAAAAGGSGSPEIAARYLRRALEEPPAPELRAELLLALAESEAAGQENDGIAPATEAVELLDPGHRRSKARRVLARMLYIALRVDEAVEVLDAAMDDASGDTELEIEIEAERFTVMRLSETMIARASERAGTMRSRDYPGETPAERKLLAMLSDQAQWSAEPREIVLDLARRGLGNGALLAEETSSGLTWICAAGSIGWMDELDEYMAIAEDCIEDARRRGSVTAYAGATYMRSFGHYYRGDLSAALADLEVAIEARHAGWAYFLVAAYAQYAWALLDRDDLDGAQGAVDEALRVGLGAPRGLVLEAAARIALVRGEPASALELALEAGATLTAATVISPAVAPWRGTAAVAAARVGEAERSAQLAEEELTLARRMGAPRVIGMALRAAGMSRPGADGLALLEEAVEVLEGSPAKLELARTLIEQGVALRRAGQRTGAREPLRRGLDMAHRFGAHALERRAREELAAAGARVRSPVTSGPESLTPSEQRIAEMAAEGRSNPAIAQALFVTRRTVESHLTSAYRKLGIASRDELAGALARLNR